MDVGDPGGGGVYPGLAGGGAVDVGDQGVDHVEVEDAAGGGVSGKRAGLGVVRGVVERARTHSVHRRRRLSCRQWC